MKTDMPHENHENHLCYLQNINFLSAHLEEYKKLVDHPKFLCRACGRTANKAENLCLPVEL